jgi:dTDP-4-amino-4,6-dideoxygalactose transaminase
MDVSQAGRSFHSDPGIAARAQLMCTHGVNRDSFDQFRKVGASWVYDVVAPGFKYNMTDVAAAIGVVQLTKAEALRKSRQKAALQYFERLAGLPLDLPSLVPEGSLHCWHLFPVRIHESSRVTRDEVIEALAAAGVGSSVHYQPLHMMTYWKERYPSQPGEFPVANRYFAGAMTLPLFPGMTDAEIEYVASLLQRVLG